MIGKILFKMSELFDRKTKGEGKFQYQEKLYEIEPSKRMMIKLAQSSEQIAYVANNKSGGLEVSMVLDMENLADRIAKDDMDFILASVQYNGFKVNYKFTIPTVFDSVTKKVYVKLDELDFMTGIVSISDTLKYAMKLSESERNQLLVIKDRMQYIIAQNNEKHHESITKGDLIYDI